VLQQKGFNKSNCYAVKFPPLAKGSCEKIAAKNCGHSYMTSDTLASVSFNEGDALHGLFNQTPGDRASQWAAAILPDLPRSSGSSTGNAERRDHRMDRRGQMDSEDNPH
jgi:hypothetical protein